MNGFSARFSSTLFVYNINKHLTIRTLPVIYIIFSMTVTVAVQRGPAGRRLPYQPRLSLIVILSIYYPVFKSLMGALDTKSLVSLSNTKRYQNVLSLFLCSQLGICPEASFSPSTPVADDCRADHASENNSRAHPHHASSSS